MLRNYVAGLLLKHSKLGHRYQSNIPWGFSKSWIRTPGVPRMVSFRACFASKLGISTRCSAVVTWWPQLRHSKESERHQTHTTFVYKNWYTLI